MVSMKDIIGKSGIMPIMVPDNSEDAVHACEAILSCGINTIEVVF